MHGALQGLLSRLGAGGQCYALKKIGDVLREGNKVIVRSKISGTQRGALIGFPAKHREMSIQAIDIREFKDGKIVRTWHTED